MTAGTLAPECAESMSHRRLYLPAEAAQQHLASSNPSVEQRTNLYGALLSSRVWVTQCEVGLGEAGPFVELLPMSTIAGPLLAIYTSPDRVPGGGVTAEAIAFADLLEAIADDLSLLVDPPRAAVVISPADLAMLREVLADL